MGLWRQVTDGAGLFYVCIRAIRGKAAGSAACTPSAIFQASFCRQKQTAQGLTREGGEEKLPAEGEGRQDRWDGSLISCFCTTAFFFILFLRHLSNTLQRCRCHASLTYWQQQQDGSPMNISTPRCQSFCVSSLHWTTLLLEAHAHGQPQHHRALRTGCTTGSLSGAAPT